MVYLPKRAASNTPTPKPTASPSSRVSGVCMRRYAWQKTQNHAHRRLGYHHHQPFSNAIICGLKCMGTKYTALLKCHQLGDVQNHIQEWTLSAELYLPHQEKHLQRVHLQENTCCQILCLQKRKTPRQVSALKLGLEFFLKRGWKPHAFLI